MANSSKAKAVPPIDPVNLPGHIAVIMDGNNRWTKENGKRGLSGHKAGADSARNLLKLCVKNDIPFLTLFVFSSENWNRPESEVKGLMSLFLGVLKKSEIEKLHAQNIKLKFIGRRDRFSKKIINLMESAERLTENNNKLTVLVAADYGGKWDIANAAKVIAKGVVDKKIKLEEISDETVNQAISTHGIPEPDLCIRTGGDNRISNFLLWQFAYTELYFTETYWPDFDEIQFNKALKEYQSRERRFGKKSKKNNSLKNRGTSDA